MADQTSSHHVLFMISELSRHILALPQELQDQILEHAVHLPCKSRVQINPLTLPPWQLSLNHVTRNRLATAYYANNVFRIVIPKPAHQPVWEMPHRDILILDRKRWLDHPRACSIYGVRRSRQRLLRQLKVHWVYLNLRCWLRGLAVEHRAAIRRIRLHDPGESRMSPEDERKFTQLALYLIQEGAGRKEFVDRIMQWRTVDLKKLLESDCEHR